MSSYSYQQYTASAHDESAGRFRQDSLTLEDCIAKVYSGLEQIDSDTARVAEYLNNSQSYSPSSQPIASTSSSQQTALDVFDLSFLEPGFTFDFTHPFGHSSSSFVPLDPSSAPVVPQIPLLSLSAETLQSWAPPHSDVWNFDQPASLPQANLDVQLFGQQCSTSMNQSFDAGVSPMNVVSDDLANYFVNTSSSTVMHYSSVDEYVLPPPPDFSDMDFKPSPSPQSREIRPLPRHGSASRPNPRWSPASDETSSDGDYQPPRSLRKRTAVGSPPQSNAAKRFRVGEDIQAKVRRALDRGEKRNQIKEEVQESASLNDDDVSRTVYDLKRGKLVLRCPSMSGCSRRFDSIEDAVAHIVNEHPSEDKNRLRCPFQCSHVLYNPGDIDRHRESLAHTPKKGFTCLACLHSYTRKDPLKRHHDKESSHKPLHHARLDAGVEPIRDAKGVWTLKAPHGYKDSACKNPAFSIDTLSHTEKLKF
ncbi:hypothetical protein V5O48_002388 [Marasmius crinis-equi]|uniref:C2H2-type domain-containing protein n=1 Tax=Marasmius crinis-equi TaxID=585013 RepID=A0ABR3FWV7_9AGAR